MTKKQLADALCKALFGNKFESYLHGPVPQKKQKLWDEDEDAGQPKRKWIIGECV